MSTKGAYVRACVCVARVHAGDKACIAKYSKIADDCKY